MLFKIWWVKWSIKNKFSLNQTLYTVSKKSKQTLKHNVMKKVTVMVFFCWLGLLNGSIAQSVAIVRIKPVPYIVRPVSPGPGHVWVSGYWTWDRRYKRNVWVNGYWARVPQRHHFYGRRVRVY